jgi:hypothetical protein
MQFAPRSLLLLSLTWLITSCGGSTADSPQAAAGSAGAAGVGGAAGAGSGGSGGAAGAAPVQTGPQLPCAVEKLVKTRCQQCHGSEPLYGAPMSLVTYDDLTRRSTVEPAVTITDRMLVRMRSYDKPMPQPPAKRASIDELAVLDNWVEDEFAPRAAGETCPDTGPDPVQQKPPSCDPDVTLAPTGSWTMPQDTDDVYVCYGIDVAASDVKRQVTGIVPIVDNTKIVHHLLVFEIDKSEDSTPHPCAQAFPIDWKAIYAWGPGTPAYELPAQAGFPVEAGETKRYAVQVHYSNLKHAAGEQDATRIGLCTTPQLRPFDADIMWVGSFDFSIPAHKQATVSCDFDFKKTFGKYMPIHVFQAWPHMHVLGTRLETNLVHPDGVTEGLGLAAPYDFNNQITYPVEVSIYPGDVVHTECTWDNVTDKKVKFGEATSEEMCFNLLAYYPRIPLPQFSGPAASYLSECQMK